MQAIRYEHALLVMQDGATQEVATSLDAHRTRAR
jgi:hypothetical protein